MGQNKHVYPLAVAQQRGKQAVALVPQRRSQGHPSNEYGRQVRHGRNLAEMVFRQLNPLLSSCLDGRVFLCNILQNLS